MSVSTKVCSMALFQYIQQNIRSDCSNIDKILEPPEGQDEGVWKYEHLRYVLGTFIHTFLKTFSFLLQYKRRQRKEKHKIQDNAESNIK